MKIVTLMENSASREGLEYEHGLSLYIETGNRKILFDAGQSDATLRNAQKLGVDLGAVDFAVLSHGHYDHSGGLAAFLELNRTAPVYVRPDAFEGHFNAAEKDIGVDAALLQRGRLIFTEDTVTIAPGIALCSANDRPRPFGTDCFGLKVQRQGRLWDDDFCHEQYLLVEEQGRRFCFSGCSHKGILNIVDWFRPDVLIGGFHFMKVEDAAVLDAAANRLLAYDTVYFTGHCTGGSQYARLKEIMGDRLHAISAGKVLEFS